MRRGAHAYVTGRVPPGLFWDVTNLVVSLEEFRKILELDPLVQVRAKPKLVRLAQVRIIVNEPGAMPVRNLLCTRGQIHGAFRPYEKARVKLMNKEWAVFAGSDMLDRWPQVDQAVAHREALEFHYAKFLMTRKTEAHDGVLESTELWARKKR